VRGDAPLTGTRVLLGRALTNGAAAALGHAGLLLSMTVLARLLGAEDYGRYALVLTWLTVLTLLANRGADQTLLRYVAAYRVNQDWAGLQGVLQWARRYALRSALGLAALAAAAVLLLGERVSPQTRWTFLVACLAVPLASQGQIRQFGLRALHRFALGIFPQQILQPLLLTLLLLGLHGLGAPLHSALAMALNLGCTGLALVLLMHLQRRHLPAQALTGAPRQETEVWRQTALPLLVVSGMHLAMSHTDMLMLGLLAEHAATGIYNAASRLSGIMAFGLMTVNTVLAPLISELFAAGHRERLQRVVSLAALGTTAALLPVALALVLGGKWLLGLFGPAFTAGYPPLLILGLGQLINAVSGSVGYLLTLSGHPAEVSRILTLTSLLNLAGNALLIPVYGAAGAAASTAASMALWNLVLVWRVRRLTGIRPTALSRLHRP
jgi:O-antigen/teichoic acid export membrane protein